MAQSEKYIALTYRDFRLLWFGLFFSSIGSWMQFTAINWHIYELTHSAFALGLIGLARFLPIAFFAILAGTIADAHNRKTILLVTQIALAILSGILTFVTFHNIVTPVIIYVITALSAVAIAFDTPPRQAIIPSLVKREHLPNAMSLNVIMRQTASIAGPAIAGLLIASTGIGSIYLVNALSFTAIIVALLMMKTSGAIEGEVSPVSLKAMVDGFRFVISKKLIWSTMVLDFFSTFFASATALLPLFADSILHVGPTGFGILSSAPAIGAVLAGFIMAHFGMVKHQGRLLLAAVSIYGVATILFGLSKIFILSFIALFFIGVGDSISTVIRNTIRQLATPDHIRGRMTSVNMIFFMGGPQLGEFEAGLLAAAIGGPASVVIGGIGTLFVVGLVAFKVPILRNYTGEKSDKN